MAPPEVSRAGLGYLATFKTAGFALTVKRLRERSGELSGELKVERLPQGEATEPVHLYQARFNLSSGATRKSTAKTLAERIEADWESILELFSLHILRLHRKGEPFEMAGGPREKRILPLKLLDPILTVGEPTILFAPGGTGKSTFAAAIAVSVTTGAEVIPGFKPFSAPVLILDWEARREDWDDRIAAIADGVGVESPRIHYRHCAVPLADQVEEVSEYVAEYAIQLVIIDSVGMASGTSRDGADPKDSATDLFTAVRLIGATSLLIDHVTGADLQTQGAISKPYGSVYKVNLARSVFELRREKEGDQEDTEVVLRHTKANNGPVLKAIGFSIRHSEWTIRFSRTDLDSPELEKTLPVYERLTRTLLRSGAMTVKALSEEVEIPAATIRQYIRRYPKRFIRLQDGSVAVVAPGGS